MRGAPKLRNMPTLAWAWHPTIGNHININKRITMQTADELKKIFQQGWNLPVRIDNYVRNVADGEFAEGAGLAAWKSCLAVALPGKRAKILDIGTGPGVYACLYAQLGHVCIGLDFSARMLGEARRRARRLGLNCTFVFGDAECPPLESESFDVVSSRHLLFNLPHPGLAVRQWMRILKPGGMMILIGEDSQEQPRSKAGRRLQINRRLRQLRGPKAKDSSPRWTPSPDYLNAVSQCPLFRQGKGPIQALMEAVGLCDIRSLDTAEIAAARAKKSPGSRSGAPFILAGKKL
jgi:SAM-dependent methyltransferase